MLALALALAGAAAAGAAGAAAPADCSGGVCAYEAARACLDGGDMDCVTARALELVATHTRGTPWRWQVNLANILQARGHVREALVLYESAEALLLAVEPPGADTHVQDRVYMMQLYLAWSAALERAGLPHAALEKAARGVDILDAAELRIWTAGLMLREDLVPDPAGDGSGPVPVPVTFRVLRLLARTRLLPSLLYQQMPGPRAGEWIRADTHAARFAALVALARRLPDRAEAALAQRPMPLPPFLGGGEVPAALTGIAHRPVPPRTQVLLRAPIEEWIDAVQFPPAAECATRPLVVFRFGPSAQGLGSQINFLMAVMSQALARNRTLVMAPRDEWNYAHAATCEQRGWGCYFEQISSCDAPAGVAEDSVPRLDLDLPAEAQAGHRVLWADLWTVRRDSHRTAVPGPAAELDMLAWRSLLTRRVFRPLPRVHKHIEAIRQRVGWTDDAEPVVAMHIRGGFKFVEMPPRPIADYLAAAEYLCAACRVFVATDSPDIAARVPDRATIMIDRTEPRRHSDTSSALFLHAPAPPSADEVARSALDAIANLWLLAQGRYFVGSFSSNFGRLAFQIMVAEHRLLAPAVTLDVPWMVSP